MISRPAPSDSSRVICRPGLVPPASSAVDRSHPRSPRVSYSSRVLSADGFRSSPRTAASARPAGRYRRAGQLEGPGHFCPRPCRRRRAGSARPPPSGRYALGGRSATQPAGQACRVGPSSFTPLSVPANETWATSARPMAESGPSCKRARPSPPFPGRSTRPRPRRALPGVARLTALFASGPAGPGRPVGPEQVDLGPQERAVRRERDLGGPFFITPAGGRPGGGSSRPSGRRPSSEVDLLVDP